MLGRIAVIITGEVRTWSITKQSIFDYVESLSDNIDYYFVSWNETTEFWKHDSLRQIKKTVTDADIIQSFNNRNLVSYKLIPLIETDNGYYLRAHLSKIANILKRQYELKNDFIYDQVVELRPDVYIPKKSNVKIACCDFEYVVGEVYTHYQELPSIPDLYLRTSSAGNDILATRNSYNRFDDIKQFKNLLVRSMDFEPVPSSRDPHYILLDFIMSKRLIPLKNQSEAEQATVVRPNFPDNFATLSIEEIRELYHKYTKYIDNL
jgi:hypothetical protein